MSAYHVTSTTKPVSATKGIARFIFAGLRALVREYQIQRAEKYMHGLSDAMLKDLGVDRSEIGAVIRNGRSYGR